MKNNNWKVLVLLIREVALKKKISHSQIAEKTSIHHSNVSRVFSLKYCPSLELFLKISSAVGVNFYFKDKDPNSDLSECFERAMDEYGRRVDSVLFKI